MSFVLSRKDFSWYNFRASLPSLLFFWFCAFCCCFYVLQTVKHQFKEIDRQDIQERLSFFLKETTSFTGSEEGRGDIKNIGYLHGLSFVRIQRAGEQVLLSEERDEGVDFQGVANIDPTTSGVWLDLENPGSEGDWTVISQAFGSGIIVQVGKELMERRKVYHSILRQFTVSALFFIPISVLLGLLQAKVFQRPLQRASDDISKILSQPKTGILLPKNEGELGIFYEQINGLLLHNQKLIAEIQSSLDNVAHDLRTPMARLRSFAEYGLQGPTDPDRLADSLSDCLEESERVLSMLNIMMSVAEAESGTMHLQKERFDIVEIIENVISLYEYISEEKKIRIRWEPNPPTYLYADKIRLNQVLANLLDNSLKYGHEGGYVHIRLVSNNDRVSIVFEDDGIGISANEIDRIWERLYRGDRSRTQQGLGLGLNYVRAVVEAHGGVVGVTSTLSSGTSFHVDLYRG